MTQPHNVATSTKPWTNQAYFDEAVRYLATMSAPCQDRSDDGSMVCTYRDQTGSACVVGHFIPNDSDIAREPRNFLKCGVSDLVRNHPELDGIAWPSSVVGRDLAMALQDAHDSPHNWGGDGFCNHQLLHTIASVYGLDPSVIDTQTWAEVDQ